MVEISVNIGQNIVQYRSKYRSKYRSNMSQNIGQSRARLNGAVFAPWWLHVCVCMYAYVRTDICRPTFAGSHERGVGQRNGSPDNHHAQLRG